MTDHFSEVTVSVDNPRGGRTVRHLEVRGFDNNPDRLAEEIVRKLHQTMGAPRVREIKTES